MSRREQKIQEYQEKLHHAQTAFKEDVEKNECPREDISSFEFLTFLQKGGFGEVFKAKKGDTIYAIKRLSKSDFHTKQYQDDVIREKKYLYALKNEFVVKLHSTAKTAESLFLIMDFAPYGDLFGLVEMHPLPEAMGKRVIYQIVLGLEYVHACNIMWRDLKMENVLIFENLRVKLADFGFAVLVDGMRHEACGSADYWAPEIYKNELFNEAVDWWALGVVICAILTRQHPFGEFDVPEEVQGRNVLTNEIQNITDAAVSADAKDLVKMLLVKDPRRRAGVLKEGIDDVRLHAWFRDIDFYEMVFEPQQWPLDSSQKIDGNPIEQHPLTNSKPDDQDPSREEFDEF
ncbi:cAMP-dependent protein kinase type 3-like [Galendromus occidentalis]|uniref:Serine/threonine-protein kinase greatwall n=1 Tax=Galendromus occidentalis TaxID=34638 RepID=A0AAJ6VVE3_9ACAR|nr:cAMP-dependent protein kinase type 3-like [Galendromus occidentalis]